MNVNADHPRQALSCLTCFRFPGNTCTDSMVTMLRYHFATVVGVTARQPPGQARHAEWAAACNPCFYLPAACSDSLTATVQITKPNAILFNTSAAL